MRYTTVVAYLLAALAVACEDGTTSESSTSKQAVPLFHFDVRTTLDAETRSTLGGDATTYRRNVKLDRGGRVGVQWSVAESRDGGLYLTRIEVLEVESDGWSLTAAPHGSPVNRGTGTGNAVRMMHAVMVTQNRSNISGKQSAQTLIELGAEGSLQVR